MVLRVRVQGLVLCVYIYIYIYIYICVCVCFNAAALFALAISALSPNFVVNYAPQLGVLGLGF